MRKINLKKGIVIATLCLIIVVEIITWGLSNADNVIQIQTSVIDNTGVLPNQLSTLTASDGGASGYYINLPQYLNNKNITKYYVEQQSIDPNTQQITTTYIEKNVGDMIYLTANQVSNLAMNIKVLYDTKIYNSTVLYNKHFEYSVDSSNIIKLDGYMKPNVNATFTAIENLVLDAISGTYQGNLNSNY